MIYKVWLIHQLTDPISIDESHIRLLARQSVRQLLSQNSQSVSQSVRRSLSQSVSQAERQYRLKDN